MASVVVMTGRFEGDLEGAQLLVVCACLTPSYEASKSGQLQRCGLIHVIANYLQKNSSYTSQGPVISSSPSNNGRKKDAEDLRTQEIRSGSRVSRVPLTADMVITYFASSTGTATTSEPVVKSSRRRSKGGDGKSTSKSTHSVRGR